MSAMNVQNLKQNYQHRVAEKKEDARQTEDETRRLELEEAMLVQKLQKTHQTERRLTDHLNKVCDQSPIKLMAQKKSTAKV